MRKSLDLKIETGAFEQNGHVVVSFNTTTYLIDHERHTSNWKASSGAVMTIAEAEKLISKLSASVQIAKSINASKDLP